jgi:threonine synthase
MLLCEDLGMRATVGMLSHFSTVRKVKTTLIVSTTGDTGPAAVQAVSDLANPLLTILVHYPQGQISELQRRQLTTANSKCVRVVAFEGGGDDMDKPIKNICTERQSKGHRKCGANSYNIGRPLMQAVHFVWTYLKVMEKLGKEPSSDNILDIVLPTGAMGNIAGAYIAKKCGLPLGNLCAAVNSNDIVFRAIETGKYHKSDKMLHTLSDAINIQLPYNFERLLFYLSDCNHTLVREWMTCVDNTAKLDLDAHWLAKLQAEFRSARVEDDQMCATLKKVVDGYNYVTDPHTAVALATAEVLGYFPMNSHDHPVAVMATASPCKFRESVTAALGEDGWKAYEEKDFPSRGWELLAAQEIPPTVFAFTEGWTLEEVQVEWEKMAREIVDALGKVE